MEVRCSSLLNEFTNYHRKCYAGEHKMATMSNYTNLLEFCFYIQEVTIET